MLIKVNKNKLKFKKNSLNTEESKNKQKEGEYYKQIKASMEKHGMINPLICVQDEDVYKICLGIKRFIIGCDLGMEEFKVKVGEEEKSYFDSDYLIQRYLGLTPDQLASNEAYKKREAKEAAKAEAAGAEDNAEEGGEEEAVPAVTL